MTKNKAIVLLSGGLDSLVSIASVFDELEIERAIYFDYGQNPRHKEKHACENICKHYDIQLETIELPWLKNISKNSALSNPNEETSNDDSSSFWIPNRNGVFLNIAAAYAESLNCKYVIIGANKEEAQTFKDNSEEFILNSTRLFSTSTNNNVEVLAPLIKMDKKDIVKLALKHNAPLELVWSCYYAKEKNCGTCPSCQLLKSALIENDRTDLQKTLF